MACGKGGDLPKYMAASIGSYVGVDIAAGSIGHARTRYSQRYSKHFPAEFEARDAFGEDLCGLFAGRPLFDVVSCQFAIHYSFMTPARARTALANAAAHLRPGGRFVGTTLDANVLVRRLRSAPSDSFGSSLVHIRFSPPAGSSKRFPASAAFGIEYRFTLAGAVEDCPEYLVPWTAFEKAS